MWARHLKVRRVEDEDAYYDQEEDAEGGGREKQVPDSEEETDPLDAFMDENNRETIDDLKKTNEKIQMLKVVWCDLEAASRPEGGRERDRRVHG